MPSSRMMPAGSVGFTYSNFDPYSRIAFIAYPFDFMEAIYQYTDVSTALYSDNFAFSGNQTYKDKGFDLKVRVIKERKFLPSVAIGFRDLAGTGLFSSEYIVANKFFNNVDLTLGMGWGALNKNGFENPLIDLSDSFRSRVGYSGGTGGTFETSTFFRGEDIGLFGGLEIWSKKIKGLRYKLELDSTNYFTEASQIQNFPVPQDSKYNFGLSYSFSDQFNFNIGYIRGNTLQFSFSFSGNYGKKNPILPKFDKPKKIKNQKELKFVNKDKRYNYLASLKYFKEDDISLKSFKRDDSRISITYSQNKYLSLPRTISRSTEILDQISPDNIEEFEFISTNAGLFHNSVIVDRGKFNLYKKTNDYISLNNSITYKEYNNIQEIDSDFKPKIFYPSIFYNLGPGFQTHIGGPDRFFVGGLSVRLDTELQLNPNTSVLGIARHPVVSAFNVLEQGSDSIIPKVRTDIIEYLKATDNRPSIARLQLNRFFHLNKNLYSKISIGIFEEMFGGLGGEVLYRDFFSNFAIGAEVWAVKQRDFDQLFDFIDYETVSGHINLYYEEPRTNILFHLSGGRYLAKDSGVTFDFSRRFKSGLRLGAFFTLTDISKEEFGEGSFDKGFYIHFPIEAFFTNYSRGISGFGLKPLTRDGGARLNIGHTLYGITHSRSINSFNRDIDDYFD